MSRPNPARMETLMVLLRETVEASEDTSQTLPVHPKTLKKVIGRRVKGGIVFFTIQIGFATNKLKVIGEHMFHDVKNIRAVWEVSSSAVWHTWQVAPPESQAASQAAERPIQTPFQQDRRLANLVGLRSHKHQQQHPTWVGVFDVVWLGVGPSSLHQVSHHFPRRLPGSCLETSMHAGHHWRNVRSW